MKVNIDVFKFQKTVQLRQAVCYNENYWPGDTSLRSFGFTVLRAVSKDWQLLHRGTKPRQKMISPHFLKQLAAIYVDREQQYKIEYQSSMVVVLFGKGPSPLKFLDTSQISLGVILKRLQIVSTIRYLFLKVIFVSENTCHKHLSYQHLPAIGWCITKAYTFRQLVWSSYCDFLGKPFSTVN